MIKDMQCSWKSLGNKGGQRGESRSPGMVAGVMSNNDKSQWMISQLFWEARSVLQRRQLLRLATALSLYIL